jgi:HD-GYP domain-containing protein (c-di-GMP phosphodiesterase class II)
VRAIMADQKIEDPTIQPEPMTVSPEQPGFSDDEGLIKNAGLKLVQKIFSASKIIQLYQLNNEVIKRTLSELVADILALIRIDGRASLRASPEFLYINDVRIQMDSQTAHIFFYLIEEMKKRGVEALEFYDRVEADEIGAFLKLFYGVELGEDTYDALKTVMDINGVRNIEIQPWIDRETRLGDSVSQDQDVRSESNQVFFRTVHLMKGILQTIEQKHVIQVKKAKRLTQQMTDIINTDESILLGLASIKDFDEYTYAHSVNVCILSMLTGDRLHLYKQDIAKLGLAALFHDIGKVHIPAALINGTEELAKKDWELMKYHTFLGAIELARVKTLNEIVDGMFVALQHHVHYNMNGYPRKPGGWKLRLFTRIVTIADYFDAMTSSRSYRKIPLTSDKALQFILQNSGKIFDPLIVKTFIQAIGIYPIGSVVELDTGERGVVIRQNSDCRYLHRPAVQLFSLDGGKGPLVDLTERSAGEYQFHRSIKKTLRDDEAGLSKHSCFMTE